MPNESAINGGERPFSQTPFKTKGLNDLISPKDLEKDDFERQEMQ